MTNGTTKAMSWNEFLDSLSLVKKSRFKNTGFELVDLTDREAEVAAYKGWQLRRYLKAGGGSSILTAVIDGDEYLIGIERKMPEIVRTHNAAKEFYTNIAIAGGLCE